MAEKIRLRNVISLCTVNSLKPPAVVIYFYFSLLVFATSTSKLVQIILYLKAPLAFGMITLARKAWVVMVNLHDLEVPSNSIYDRDKVGKIRLSLPLYDVFACTGCLFLLKC